jgi:short-subunit dehydrogenase
MSYWKNKAAIVTGGSSGLGLAIARVLVERGARVTIAARNVEKLHTAAAELENAGGQVLAVPTDITRDDDVDRLLAQTTQRFGRLDLLVNCAGASARGALVETGADEFAKLMDLNLVALVRCTKAALPFLLASKGQVVNIGSLASKSAGPYLGAYPATKFAVAAYTQQLRLELGPKGLHVLLVCPGPIQRDEVRDYGASTMQSLPASAAKPGGGVKVSRIDPTWLAGRILLACERRQPELIVPAKARLLFTLAALSPRLGDWLVRKMMKD